MEITFDKNAIKNEEVERTVKSFLAKVDSLEKAKGIPILIHQDGVKKSYYIRCTISGETMSGLVSLDARLDPQSIDTFRDKIVEIHASGVSRGIDHFPLETNDKVDYPLIMNKLNEIEYQGPIIFEICYARTINDIIAYCKSAKKEIVSYWNQA